jgi:hypothetical protein
MSVSYAGSLFAGLFRRLAAGTRAVSQVTPKREGPLRVERLEPRQQCAVEVTQEFNFIVIDGEPDAGSLDIQHEPGATAQTYDDKIVVSWSTGGERQTKSFDLYKYVERGDRRWAVKNIEYVEFSGGRGKSKYWSQAKISTYLNTKPIHPEVHEAIYGEGSELLWTSAATQANADS